MLMPQVKPALYVHSIKKLEVTNNWHKQQQQQRKISNELPVLDWVLLATRRDNSIDVKAVFMIINRISLILRYHQVSKALADNRIEGQIRSWD
jgi:glycyl-tRNA synthetase alpha subunit